jgi:plasmid stabilization system protein ParE
MRFRVVVHPEAAAEAIAAAEYIAREGYPSRAEAWYGRFEALVGSLGEMPSRFPVAREQESQGLLPGLELRQALVNPYRVVFFVQGGEVHIVHVRHGARDTLGPDRV